MCPHCRAFITTKDRVCPYCQENVGARAVDTSSPVSVLGGMIPHARFATTMILLVNFGLYAAMVVYSMGLGNGSAFMDLDLQTLYQFGDRQRAASAPRRLARRAPPGDPQRRRHHPRP